MHRYQLKVAGRGAGDGQIVEFESQDTAGALNVLTTMNCGSRAELWQDNNFICTIKKDAGGDGVWAVGRALDQGAGRER